MMVLDLKKDQMMQRVSGRGLLFAVLIVSVLGLGGLSWLLLNAAWRTQAQLFATVENRLLTILEEDGLSGLAFELDRIDRALIPGGDKVEVAVWQVRPNTRRLIRETEPGLAEGLLDHRVTVTFGAVKFQSRAVDVAAASENWALPMADVDLRFAIAVPTVEVRFAQTTVALVGGSFALALFLALLMQYDHRKRYKRGLSEINGVLDRYSAGETGLLIDGAMPAPELRVLGQHLNTVLPKLDTLMADLRTTSAHLAHELKNPLQKIRSNVRRLAGESDGAAKSEIVGTIDRSIDLADSRLESVMQLFRLQADSEVAMKNDIPLGEALVDLVYDHEIALTRNGRCLDIAVDEAVHVWGNAHLIGLMIENLLLNAAKYASGESTIRIALDVSDAEFCLRIENAGALPAGAGDILKTRFAQGADNASLTGAGLGLSLVDSIAKTHVFSFKLAMESRPKNRSFVRAEIVGPGKVVHD